MGNRREILTAHKQAQDSRISGGDELVVVADTTYLTFPRHPANEGLGDINSADIDVEGVKVHPSIGIRPETQRMTGVIDQHLLIEDQQSGDTYDANGKDEPVVLEHEHEKWGRGDRAVTEWLPDGVRPIFVHDWDGDAFSVHNELYRELDNAGFVIRANQTRRIRTVDGEVAKLFDWSGDLPEEGRTTIKIQQGSSRQAREATLSIAIGRCDLLPPRNDAAGMDPVTVNVVRIDELCESEAPIQWVLLTTESVETFDDALTITEYYRARWRIEDWHKVLKTGCEIEERQLQT